MGLDRRLRDQLIRQVNDPELRVLLGATALVESGGRLDAVGDRGQSFGPFQEYTGGRGAGLTPAQRQDPSATVARALKEFTVFKGRGFSGAELAYRSQRPADKSGYIRKINAALGQARAELGGASPTPPKPSVGADALTAPTLDATDIAGLIRDLPAVDDGTAVPRALSKTLGLGSRAVTLTSKAKQDQIDALLAGLQSPAPAAAVAEASPPRGDANPNIELLANDGGYGWAQEIGKRFGLRLASTYRSPAKNRAVGGSKTSAHMTRGGATDFAGSPAAMRRLAEWAIDSGQFREVFFDPVGQWDNGVFNEQGIGGHDDHVHLTR